MLWELSLRVESQPASLRIARKLVRELALLAGASDSEASEVEVSAGEALSNAHRHAYPDDVGPIGIEVQAFPTCLCVAVHDDGKEVSAPTVPNVLPDRGSRGGQGLYLIGRMMDCVEIGIDRQGHGVILRMMRHFGRAMG